MSKKISIRQCYSLDAQAVNNEETESAVNGFRTF